MHFDLATVEPVIAYKLLAATVMPRPIAWVVTQNSEGNINAAPYSFFNAMGANPPTVAIGLLADVAKGFKDTAKNILETAEFVINLVPESLVNKMNMTAVNAPYGMDELQLAGLETTPSIHVKPPRITDSPVAFECKLLSSVVTGPHQTIVIGRVLGVHVVDEHVLDKEKGYVDTPAFDLVARSFGSDYVRTKDVFTLERPVWGEQK